MSSSSTRRTTCCEELLPPNLCVSSLTVGELMNPPASSFAWFSLGNWCKAAVPIGLDPLRASVSPLPPPVFRTDIIMYILTTSMEDASFDLKGIHYFVRASLTRTHSGSTH